MKQITASVTFLPVLEEECKLQSDRPKQWTVHGLIRDNSSFVISSMM